MKVIELNTPLIDKTIEGLKAGDKVMLSGNVLVARDQAHLRLNEMIKKKLKLPIDLSNQIIYYAGPSPAKPGFPVGAIGPTTSARMDSLTELLLKAGIGMTIGKGERSKEMRKMIKKYKAPYLAAMGGGGAVLHEAIVSSKMVAFRDLGPEAIRMLTVKNMPLFVAYDVWGGSIYSD